jgi:hypothetical protein
MQGWIWLLFWGDSLYAPNKFYLKHIYELLHVYVQ